MNLTCTRHNIPYLIGDVCPMCREEASIMTGVGGGGGPLAGTPTEDAAEALLNEAAKIVTGARRAAYGKPEDNFKMIADLWTTYLKRTGAITYSHPGVSATNVAIMMILMKCARLAETPNHHDSTVDIAGYAACLARCQEPPTCPTP